MIRITEPKRVKEDLGWIRTEFLHHLALWSIPFNFEWVTLKAVVKTGILWWVNSFTTGWISSMDSFWDINDLIWVEHRRRNLLKLGSRLTVKYLVYCFCVRISTMLSITLLLLTSSIPLAWRLRAPIIDGTFMMASYESLTPSCNVKVVY